MATFAFDFLTGKQHLFSFSAISGSSSSTLVTISGTSASYASIAGDQKLCISQSGINYWTKTGNNLSYGAGNIGTTGTITLGSNAYVLPTSGGTSGQTLTFPKTGNVLAWTSTWNTNNFEAGSANYQIPTWNNTAKKWQHTNKLFFNDPGTVIFLTNDYTSGVGQIVFKKYNDGMSSLVQNDNAQYILTQGLVNGSFVDLSTIRTVYTGNGTTKKSKIEFNTINTSTKNVLTLQESDVYLPQFGCGIIMYSSGGTGYRLSVTNGGALSITAI